MICYGLGSDDGNRGDDDKEVVDGARTEANVNRFLEDFEKMMQQFVDRAVEVIAQVSKVHGPSPLTCSLVTVAGLLSEVRKTASDEQTMATLVVTVAVADRRGATSGEVKSNDEMGDDAAAQATTRFETRCDTPNQSFCRRAGTDVRRFRIAPNPPTGGRQQARASAGMTELGFWVPPNPARKG